MGATRGTGPAATGPECRWRQVNQAVSRTFLATAMPIATKIKITRSFFIEHLSAGSVGSWYATPAGPATLQGRW
jgi:hypothetical protein